MDKSSIGVKLLVNSSPMKGLRPLLNYYGGDVRMAPHILPYVESIPHTVWVEVFGGGAAMTFAKPRRVVGNNNDYREVINDINGLITTFYRVAREQPEQLHRYLEHTPYSQADHRQAIAICKSPKQYSDLEVAWAVYINCNCSFANQMNKGWAAQVTGSNPAATWEKRIERLPLQLERVSGVHISNEDCLACLKRWSSPHTLYYLDPGYPGTDCGHYEALAPDHFAEMVEFLENCQSSFILHCYPYEGIPAHWPKVEIQTTCSASGKGKVRGAKNRAATTEELGDRKRTECLWICDRSDGMRKELSFSRYKQHSLFEAM